MTKLELLFAILKTRLKMAESLPILEFQNSNNASPKLIVYYPTNSGNFDM
jgi:hypothetical protein